MSARYLPALACFNALLALTVGAFGAHLVHDPQAREWIMTGVLFQLPHAAAVFALLGWRDTTLVRHGAWLVSGGSLVFAGSLYMMALGAPRWFGAITPIGGLAMMAGWLWLAVVAIRSKANH